MNITFEAPDKVNGLLTITIEKEDYAAEVEKQLKDLRKRANVPGFRPGKAPAAMINRQYGTSVKADVVNKTLGDKLYGYIKENNIQMLGDPMPNEAQTPQDLEKDGPFTFIFDIAVAPEFKLELSDKDTVPYYNIKVDDKMVQEQVEMFQSRAGKYETVDAYDAEKRDMLKGDLRELDADGNIVEDGINVEGAVMMPQYIKVEEQKALFATAKVGDAIVFNPRKAYPEGNAEIAGLLKVESEKAAEITADFKYLVTEISRFVPAEINQELFDQALGEGQASTEAEFREKIAASVKQQLIPNSEYKFLLDVRKHCEEKVGQLTWPDALLKRIMLAANKDKDEKYVEDNYEGSIKELAWSLMKEQLLAQTEIKVSDDDLKAVARDAARMQFAQYGMSNVPDEYLDNYADQMLKDKKNINGLAERAIDVKLSAALKSVVKLDTKETTWPEFQEMMK